MMKECAHQPCGEPFEAKRSDARFCSASCRAAASRARRQGAVPPAREALKAAVAIAAPLALSPDPELVADLEELQGEVDAMASRLEASRAEASRAEAKRAFAITQELRQDRDEANERVTDLLERVEGMDLAERMVSLELAARIEPGEQDPASRLQGIDRRLDELYDALEGTVRRLRSLKRRVETMDQEMAKAVTMLVGGE